jgi:putative colanic acid biosynthesis UDP-glucose lipid carrier transferase
MMRELEFPRPGVLGTATGTRGSPANGTRGNPANSSPARPRPERSANYATFRLGTAETPAVTVLKELLGPSVAVATLTTCVWLDASGPSMKLLALDVIVFVLSSRILTVPRLITGATGRCNPQPTKFRLLAEFAVIAAIVIFIVAALKLTPTVGAGALTAWLIVGPAALLLSNTAAVRLARGHLARASAPLRHIIIGVTDVGLELAKRVQQGNNNGAFLGFFDFRGPARLPGSASRQWIGTCDNVTAFVQRNAVGAIYIALPVSSTPRMTDLLRQLRDTTASIYFVPSNIFAFDLIQPRCMEIHGLPALAVCETPHQGMPGLQKRVMDFVLALITLILSGPLMLLIAAAIKLTSAGPVVFKQRRYGLNGEEISVYKFRSMTVCEDGSSVIQATRDDCRTTCVGRVLRRTSLDELPQILNVLQGSMSFVGPRPHAVAHNELYRKLISGYMIRHKVRPGITGWAQVNGLRGETDTLEKMRQRIEYDIDYLANWSLWLDIKILLKTLVLVLHDDHAY